MENMHGFEEQVEVPVSSVLTFCRFAGQELLTAMVGVVIPALLYTSRRFPETGSCKAPITEVLNQAPPTHWVLSI